MVQRTFGQLKTGETIDVVEIAGGGLSASIIGYGAALRSLTVDGPDGPRPVVLGFDTLADYVDHTPYFGAIAGRCANRIRDGRFELDGQTYQLDLNEGGRSHLHGGAGGFAHRAWTVTEAGPDAVTLSLHSPDGDQGYPGAVDVRCRYSIEQDGELAIELTATTDAPTLVNLATHSYFDLDRGETILDHLLTIPADAYTPVDGHLIPTGAIEPVAGTRFDFRRPRPIRNGSDADHVFYDHNFVVYGSRSDELRPMAVLSGPRSGLTLEVLSTEPGVQFYDGNQLGGVKVPLADGRPARIYGGLCLEPQAFPDAIHQPGFPSVVLRPGLVYRQKTVYRFTG